MEDKSIVQYTSTIYKYTKCKLQLNDKREIMKDNILLLFTLLQSFCRVNGIFYAIAHYRSRGKSEQHIEYDKNPISNGQLDNGLLQTHHHVFEKLSS